MANFGNFGGGGTGCIYAPIQTFIYKRLHLHSTAISPLVNTASTELIVSLTPNSTSPGRRALDIQSAWFEGKLGSKRGRPGTIELTVFVAEGDSHWTRTELQ
jgi:hypothetical protein